MYLLNLLLAALVVVSTAYDAAVACVLVKRLSPVAVVLTAIVIEMHWGQHELQHIFYQVGCIGSSKIMHDEAGSVNLLVLPPN